MSGDSLQDTVEQRSQRRSIVSLGGPAAAADGTLRCRFEMKYQISEVKAAAVEHFIQPYLSPDHYCKLQPTGSYPIVSLYLDSPDLKLCRESVTGKKNRFKLRIRGYNDDPAYPKFFEIKRRLNFVIVKDRQRVIPRDVARLLSGGPLPEQYYSTEQESLKQFLFYLHCLNARPLIQVRYIRRAYVDDSETRVRITFDRELSFRMCDQPTVMLGGPGWQRHSINDVILEIKFTSRFPAWLTRMVRCLDLQQQSFSKYVNCINGASSMRFCSPDVYGFDWD
ncbi:MAG: polyphosphate polymerase domain-containing protein [Sedimentisphaerales bacterium]|nr:polyphosphate polymerase domain-containing protein [Sedimentisphaerales bacterium]